MPPIHDTYGKGHVRVLRVARGEREGVREPTARSGPEGAAFSAADARADNPAVVAIHRGGEAALDAAPEVAEVHMARPNKYHVAFDLAPFGMDADNRVFVATDEPHGQMECRVGRG